MGDFQKSETWTKSWKRENVVSKSQKWSKSPFRALHGFPPRVTDENSEMDGGAAGAPSPELMRWFCFLSLLHQHQCAEDDLIAAIAGWQSLRPPRVLDFYKKFDLPDPASCPWALIWQTPSDPSFRKFLGLPVYAFRRLCRRFSKAYTAELHMDRARPGRPRTMDPVSIVAMVLHYIRKGVAQEQLQFVFGITAAVLCRELQRGLRVLMQVLRRWKRARVLWPSPQQMRQYADMIERRHGTNLRNVIGFVDGLNLQMQNKADPLEQNLYPPPPGRS
jgi:hypothetical protein